MKELNEKVLQESQNPTLAYSKISRRTFLKGALAVGGALALAGCKTDPPVGPDGVKTVTVTNTVTVPGPTVTVTEPGGATAVAAPAKMGPSQSGTNNNFTANFSGVIFPKYTLCTGCRKCMIACSMKHYGEVDLFKSNIQVYNYNIGGGMVDIPVLCMKCNMGANDAGNDAIVAANAEKGTPESGGPPCMKACPPSVHAITRSTGQGSTGSMLLDQAKCTACGLCVAACKETRTGCLRMSRDMMTVYGMCDLCDGMPECMLTCPEDALLLIASNGYAHMYAMKTHELAENTAGLLYGTDRFMVEKKW